MPDDQEFWMVWKDGGNAPRKIHLRLREAELEAERLARIYPCETFYILHAIASVTAAGVYWNRDLAPPF